ncbi:MAG: cytidylate kinase [Micavibrio sp.]|nr:cytidylate kinase [Micavibrio sp.]|tara:strand:- start:436 stop:1095 length:660 start_codon:yes stop_codon:yes gene_type:complete
MIIAIDGPAASGKGTLARKLAHNLGYPYMDTGKLYRATAFEVLNEGLSPKDQTDAIQAAKSLAQKIKTRGIESVLDNTTLKEDRIGNAASQVAAIAEVRQALLDIQRDFANSPAARDAGAILDGRDIGTVICPNADVKLFITADLEIRAQRRLKELQSKGLSVTYSTVLDDMRARDARDAHTLNAHRAKGYSTNIVDTTLMTPDEAFDEALRIIKASGG